MSIKKLVSPLYRGAIARQRRIRDACDPNSAYNLGRSPMKKKSAKRDLKIAHVGLHRSGRNAGDKVLFPATRLLFQDQVASIEFKPIELRSPVTTQIMEDINQTDALLIGGGGLFLSDSNPNVESGWQWACPVALIEEIKVPILLVAVGYNRFQGQSEFLEVFGDNINTLCGRSSFFGLRNSGSVEAVKSYLSEKNWHKVSCQPCPTTVLRMFYDLGEKKRRNTDVFTVGVNFAFDRSERRYFGREHEILSEVARALKKTQKRTGFAIRYFAHVKGDLEGAKYLKEQGVVFQIVNLAGQKPDKIIRYYKGIDLSIGMRGHAQMIPFGEGKPIISLESHPKLSYFLRDVGMSECGIDLHSNYLSERLENKIRMVVEDVDQYREKVSSERSRLWDLTQHNMAQIRKCLSVED